MSGLFLSLCTYCPLTPTFMPFLANLYTLKWLGSIWKPSPQEELTFTEHLLCTKLYIFHSIWFFKIAPVGMYLLLCYRWGHETLRGKGDRGGWQSSIWWLPCSEACARHHGYELWIFTGPTLSHLTTPYTASPQKVDKLRTTITYTWLKISSTCFVLVNVGCPDRCEVILEQELGLLCNAIWLCGGL